MKGLYTRRRRPWLSLALPFPLSRVARMASTPHPALAPPAGRGAGGEGKASQSFQVPPCLIGCLAEACQKGKTAGGSPAVKTARGSPAASHLSCFAKKSNQKKANPLRWPSASRSRQAQAGQCGNSLRFSFQRKRSSNIRIAFTGSTLPSAAASEGEFKLNGKVETPWIAAALARSSYTQHNSFPLSPPAGRGWPGGPGKGKDVALPSPSVPSRPED